MNTPLVSICTITYNHAPYIQECLEGFIIQKTDFLFEVIIGDDASTDNTPSIIQEYAEKYPEIIKPILRSKNVGVNENFKSTVSTSQGRYIALCEGDDYWTDPLKLQKQVDFLEKNSDYGVVYSNINYLFESKGKVQKSVYKECPDGNIFEYILRGRLPIITQTVCCKASLLKEHIDRYQNIDNGLFIIDLAVWLGLSLKTKFHYMNEVFATYRLSDESMSRSKDYTKLYLFHQKIAKIRFYFVRKYKEKLSQATRNKVYQMYYNSIFADGFALKNKQMMYRGKKGLNTLGIKLNHKQSFLYYFPMTASLLSLLKTHVKLKTK